MKFTHTGIVRGRDARTPDNYGYRVQLRETATMWVDDKRNRWSKKDGTKLPKESWPLVNLDLSSITIAMKQGTPNGS